MDIARKRLSTRSAEEAGSELQDEMKGIFVSEWLTQHPLLLAGKFPSHIWLHADCPTPEPQGATDDAAARVAGAKLSYAMERLTELNLRGIAHAQRGELDEALLAWRSMEEDLKASVPKGEQPALLAVAYNNLAGVYYARSKSAPAAQYIERAARLEQRVYGAPDFGTRLRLGAVYSRAKRHTEALNQCSLALDVLRSTEELRLDHSSRLDAAAAAAFTHGGGSTTAGGAEADGAVAEQAAVGPHEANYQAHLAVAYHNLAVELASTQQFGPASAMVDVAQHLIEQVVSPKHRWSKQIKASGLRLRDLHVSTTFVEHALRPRLAASQVRSDAMLAFANGPHLKTPVPLGSPTRSQREHTASAGGQPANLRASSGYLPTGYLPTGYLPTGSQAQGVGQPPRSKKGGQQIRASTSLPALPQQRR